MKTLDVLEAHIVSGAITHAHLGRSAMANLGGAARFCTLHLPGDENNVTGKGATSEAALAAALALLPPPKENATVAQPADDLEDLLG
jgi:hypothetical protein